MSVWECTTRIGGLGGILLLLILSNLLVPSNAFLSNNAPLSLLQSNVRSSSTRSILQSTQQSLAYTPVFDFAKDPSAVGKFERIDDAIMGGISLSSLKQSPKETFARWSGICRLDGGGFCGTRTLPFEKPIEVGEGAEGIYLECRLTSDEEPDRRVWKVTTRTEQSRGEQLYQAMFKLNQTASQNEWIQAQIPFSSFRQVRGPRLVEDAPALDVSNGLFQVGLSLSKFMISNNVTEVPNFRPGFFELQIKEIGFYGRPTKEKLDVTVPATLSKSEIAKKRPLLLKILLPLTKVFFSETRRRRDSAMRLLQKRGLTRKQAILFGIKRRAKQQGIFPAVVNFTFMASQDIFRASIFGILRLTIVTPVRILMRLIGLFRQQKSNTTDGTSRV